MIERTRSTAINPVTDKEYFSPLVKTSEDSGLKNTPWQIYNCDQIYLPLNCINEKDTTRKVLRMCLVNHIEQVSILHSFAVHQLQEYPVHQ